MADNKNINPSIFITVCFTALTLYLIIFTIGRIAEAIDKAPLNLNSDFNIVTVSTQFRNQTPSVTFKNELKTLLENNVDLILIKESSDYKKLAIYDPSGHFESILYDGTYFTKEDFMALDSRNILVHYGSSLNAVTDEGIIPLLGNQMILLGRFTTTDLFSNANNSYERIMPLLSDHHFGGTYYYIHQNQDFYTQLSTIMVNNGFMISPEKEVRHNNKVQLNSLFQRKEAFIMIPSLLIVCFSNLISFSLMIYYKKNKMYVHFIYGARSVSYLIHQMKRLLCLTLCSTAFGSGIGVIFTYSVYKQFHWLTFLATFLSTMILLLLLYLISFFTVKNRILLEGLL